MNLLKKLIPLVAASAMLTGCLHSQTEKPQGICHSLKTKINSPTSHVQGNIGQLQNNIGDQAALAKQYQSLGCDNND